MKGRLWMRMRMDGNKMKVSEEENKWKIEGRIMMEIEE